METDSNHPDHEYRLNTDLREQVRALREDDLVTVNNDRKVWTVDRIDTDTSQRTNVDSEYAVHLDGGGGTRTAVLDILTDSHARDVTFRFTQTPHWYEEDHVEKVHHLVEFDVDVPWVIEFPPYDTHFHLPDPLAAAHGRAETLCPASDELTRRIRFLDLYKVGSNKEPCISCFKHYNLDRTTVECEECHTELLDGVLAGLRKNNVSTVTVECPSPSCSFEKDVDL